MNLKILSNITLQWSLLGTECKVKQCRRVSKWPEALNDTGSEFPWVKSISFKQNWRLRSTSAAQSQTEQLDDVQLFNRTLLTSLGKITMLICSQFLSGKPFTGQGRKCFYWYIPKNTAWRKGHLSQRCPHPQKCTRKLLCSKPTWWQHIL